ncbi:putative LPS assembly protein LptD [Balneola vulgaris]|uniref:putative LPS assembly protein LptD n=1 Tax=Balneola vulgaris TaxID=287535 RepID=UPI0003778008|nr:putative LPS assembly protein LptD [Balneola vulgaris]
MLNSHFKRFGGILCCLCLTLLFGGSLLAQSGPDKVRTQDGADSPTTQPASAQKKSNVKDAVEYQSSDSLVIDFTEGRKAFLYGSARVSHSAGELTAGAIKMDLKKSEVEAAAASEQDTLSYPVLKRESDEIKSTNILFNYKTQKGRFESARVKVAEGHLIGSRVKNVSEDEVFIEDGIYSTCPPDYLYYYIKAKKMKVVDQEEIFFSNARLYILDIPYPLIFPFGYVPADLEKKRSGLLTPSYAFEAQSTRGIGLQNLGWFQYFNDYITGQISTDIFTSGSYYLSSNVQYANRDQYTGNIGIGYSQERGLEKTDPNFTTTVQKSLSLTHNQDFSPYASLNANINLRTADYFKRNSYDIDDRASTNSDSKLSYQYKHPENLFSFGISSQLNQNFSENTTNLRGPSANFSLKTLTPFQKGTGDAKWYETLSIRYANNLESKFEYDPIDADSAEVTFLEALFDPDKYEEATGNNDHYQYGVKQSVSAQVSQLAKNPFINLSGGISYNEYWVSATTQKTFNADSNRVETTQVPGFATARDFSTNLSFSTTFYGVSNAQIGKFQGFRHTVRPQLTYSYRPDFGKEHWGYYKTVPIDSAGNTRQYSIFEGQIFRGPGAGEQQSLNFSVRNVFETKIVERDTTGEVNEKKLKLIDNLSASLSYNFAADSLKLSQMNTSLSSSAISGLSLRANARFSFYDVDSSGIQINRFLIENGEKLAQLQSFSASASTSFKGGSRGIEVYTPVYRRIYDPYNQSRFHPIDPHFNDEPVTPFNSPWSVSLNFNYSWTYRFNQKPNKSATINAQNISFRLTPKWRFSTRLGYDFIQEELTPSQFNLTRNLECWDLSFQINPFGDNQYYFFSLRLNNAQIQSLFQKLPVLKNLERSSSPTGRRYRGGGGNRF